MARVCQVGTLVQLASSYFGSVMAQGSDATMGERGDDESRPGKGERVV